VNRTLPEAIRIKRGVRQEYPMSCLLYNITIEPLAEMIRKSTLKGFKIQGIQEKTLVSLFADDTLVYMNKKDKRQTLERIISTFCKASIVKFNKEKTEILPIGSKKYREQIIEKRQTSCKEAKLQAGIKPTALCSAIDKENSIESPLDSATLYIQLLSWLCTLSPTVLMPVS